MSDELAELIAGMIDLGLASPPRSSGPQPTLELWLQHADGSWSRWGASGGWGPQREAPLGAADEAPETDVVWLRGPDGLFQRVERP